jgi:hypothetical protein
MRFPGIPRLCKKSSFFSGEIFGFVKWTSAFSGEHFGFVQWRSVFSGEIFGFVKWTSAFAGENVVQWTTECLFWGKFWFENYTLLQKRALSAKRGCAPPTPSGSAHGGRSPFVRTMLPNYLMLH